MNIESRKNISVPNPEEGSSAIVDQVTPKPEALSQNPPKIPLFSGFRARSGRLLHRVLQLREPRPLSGEGPTGQLNAALVSREDKDAGEILKGIKLRLDLRFKQE